MSDGLKDAFKIGALIAALLAAGAVIKKFIISPHGQVTVTPSGGNVTVTTTPIVTPLPGQPGTVVITPVSTPTPINLPYSLDTIVKKINAYTRYQIPMSDYVLVDDVGAEYYRATGGSSTNARAFYDSSTGKIYLDRQTATGSDRVSWSDLRTFPLIVAHESCHYLLDHWACRQMVGSYDTFYYQGSTIYNEENFCNIFAFRVFPELGSLGDAAYRVRPDNVECIDSYMQNLGFNCSNSNRFTCDITPGKTYYGVQ